MKTGNARSPLTRTLSLTLMVLALWFASPRLYATDKSAPPAPEFKQPDPAAWINADPLTLAGLRGQVVLVYVWNIDSLNCTASLPWLREMEKKFGARGLRVIDVHTPETDAQKDRDVVNAKVQDLMIKDPVMLDNDMHYWNALHNHYWPAFYFIDRQGRLRGSFIGETRADDPRAADMENLLTILLAEPRPGAAPP